MLFQVFNNLLFVATYFLVLKIYLFLLYPIIFIFFMKDLNIIILSLKMNLKVFYYQILSFLIIIIFFIIIIHCAPTIFIVLSILNQLK